MEPLFFEFFGTAILILLGNGVVANVLLRDSKGNGGGWIVITFGWAIGVFVAVFVSAPYSGAHLNPAVTLALCLMGKFEWTSLPGYVISQILGAMTGSTLVWMTYRKHYDITLESGHIAATFCTAPAVRALKYNFLTECTGTFVLITGILYIIAPAQSLGALDALPVALLVLGIGLSLGGTTGYAINPARDLGPRLVHAILPLRNKGATDWAYAWVPVLGPVAGSVLAVLLFNTLH